MNSTRHYLRQWRENPAREILAGAVATFALIPEVIAFSFTAGVDPAVGLYASFVISIVIAVFGGRPAMISAAAGSIALVVAPLVQEHGVQYLFAAGLLAGVFQIVFGFARLATLMRYVSRSVRTGFVNALAILIFMAQIPELIGVPALVYPMVALGLAIIYLVPRVTQAIPSPLICILVGWLTLMFATLGFRAPRNAVVISITVAAAALIAAAGLLSAWLAQRLIAAPLIKVVGEIRHVERFDLDKVARHPSRLAEIENLSGAIGDMAQGLAAFRKYIPADLVRRLVSDGNGARLGGAVRPMSVMFVDLAGFTGMSERLGDRIIPLLSRYFDIVSAAIQQESGTIDKFIGDAVMAFWGAPAANPDHATDCCRAALACQRAVAQAGLVDDSGEAVSIRIGINSGDMLVGNIGSEVRLNYTVIGDAVNIASRLEGTNKVYGSTIIIGPETRRLAGDRIVVRELDRLAVYGRAGGLEIYELLAMADEGAIARDWIASYEAGLSAWRAGDFTAAIAAFERTLKLRGTDVASTQMIARCQHQLDNPAGGDWDGTTVARSK